MKNLIEFYFHFNFHHLQMKSRENVLMKVNNFFMVFTNNLYQEQKSVNNHVKTISFNLQRGFCDTYSFVKIHTHTHTHTPNKYHTEQKKTWFISFYVCFIFALYVRMYWIYIFIPTQMSPKTMMIHIVYRYLSAHSFIKLLSGCFVHHFVSCNNNTRIRTNTPFELEEKIKKKEILLDVDRMLYVPHECTKICVSIKSICGKTKVKWNGKRDVQSCTSQLSI